MTNSIRKNMGKQASYALALSMIKRAIEHDCPLQAVTIEESILADRLYSTINAGTTRDKPLSGTLNGALLQWEWKCEKDGSEKSVDSRFDGEVAELRPELKHWWGIRCELLHGIAKSVQGKQPNYPASEFMEKARSAARDGLKYLRIVDRWTKRKIRASRKEGMTI